MSEQLEVDQSTRKKDQRAVAGSRKSQIRAIEAQSQRKGGAGERSKRSKPRRMRSTKSTNAEDDRRVATAAQIKAEIEADLAKLKAALEHFGAKVKSHSATK